MDQPPLQGKHSTELPSIPLCVTMAVLALPGWSLSLTHQLPTEVVALTMTSCPRSSGKCNKPLAALVMTHIPVSNATSSRLNTPGWESPISSRHGATRCNGPAGCGGNAVGQQLLSITGVSEVAVVTCCKVSRQPRPSRAPADAIPPRAAWPALSGLANSRGSCRAH